VNKCALHVCALQMVTTILESLPEEERSGVLLVADNEGRTALHSLVRRQRPRGDVSIH